MFKIKLGIAEITWTWKVGTEAKVVRVLRERGRMAAIKYYKCDIKSRNVEWQTSRDYIDYLEEKYNIIK
ncbi:hypothetical protein [Paenibacillus medicaginis]|uniref:Uncharacterized protein n=1 Tax=Paenibacillus medicaginis TaxID=1470560 RepID=A0ABV5BUT2_9BACL